MKRAGSAGDDWRERSLARYAAIVPTPVTGSGRIFWFRSAVFNVSRRCKRPGSAPVHVSCNCKRPRSLDVPSDLLLQEPGSLDVPSDLQLAKPGLLDVPSDLLLQEPGSGADPGRLQLQETLKTRARGSWKPLKRDKIRPPADRTSIDKEGIACPGCSVSQRRTTPPRRRP